MTVTPRAIVERLDVIEDVGLREFSRPVDPPSNPLFLQAAKEGLDDGVVPAVASTAHAR